MTWPGAGGGWRIDPGAATSAIVDAKNGASQFDDVGAVVQTAIDEVSGVVGPETAAALAILVQNPFLQQIAAIKAGVDNAADQTRLALDAYVQGDEEMATHYAGGRG